MMETGNGLDRAMRSEFGEFWVCFREPQEESPTCSKEKHLGTPCRLRIQHGHCYGSGSVPNPGSSAFLGAAKKKKKDVRLIGLMSLQLASDENSHQNNG